MWREATFHVLAMEYERALQRDNAPSSQCDQRGESDGRLAGGGVLRERPVTAGALGETPDVVTPASGTLTLRPTDNR